MLVPAGASKYCCSVQVVPDLTSLASPWGTLATLVIQTEKGQLFLTKLVGAARVVAAIAMVPRTVERRIVELNDGDELGLDERSWRLEML